MCQPCLFSYRGSKASNESVPLCAYKPGMKVRVGFIPCCPQHVYFGIKFTDFLSINEAIETRGSNLMTKYVIRDVSGCIFLDTKFSQFLFGAVMFV